MSNNRIARGTHRYCPALSLFFDPPIAPRPPDLRLPPGLRLPGGLRLDDESELNSVMGFLIRQFT